MSSFIVNESLFVLDMDDTSESYLQINDKLPDGIIIGEEKDRGEEFTFYVSEDGRYDLLALSVNLAQRYIKEGYLLENALYPYTHPKTKEQCFILISPSSHVLCRLSDARVYGSSYYAHMIAACMYHTRAIDPFINLRDGILCELYGLVLPTFTLTPKVADIALLNNTLRSQYATEDIRGDNEFADGKGGLNVMTFQQSLSDFDMEKDKVSPFFQVGELVDDFVQINSNASIAGPLELREEFQIFATDTDKVLLCMTQEWAEKLIEHNLITQMDLKSVQLGKTIIKILPLSRRYAVESLNNRHYGVSQNDVLNLSLALHRARKALPEASFTDALYIQELGLVLPTKFTQGDRTQDVEIMRSVTLQGPFAQSSFLTDVLTAAIAIVNMP